MVLNLASRIVINCLFREMEAFLKETFDNATVAVSPILEKTAIPPVIDHVIRIKSHLHDYSLCIFHEGIKNKEKLFLSEYLKKNLNYLTSILLIIFHKEIWAQYFPKKNIIPESENYYSIDLAIKKDSHSSMLYILIPRGLLLYLFPNIKNESPSLSPEESIISYFKHTEWLIPSLSGIILGLNEKELAILINRLQSQNLLSVYQIVLTITAFPELSLKIKKALSQNIINDVLNFKLEMDRYKINKRDLRGGIYSIEESIYRMMKEGQDFSYSSFLNRMEEIIRSIAGMELLMEKNFIEWITEMAENNLLYKTIALCSEATVAQAVSSNRDMVMKIISGHASEHKIQGIETLIKKTDYSRMIEAQLRMIQTYRSLKFEEIKPGPESLDYLLARFIRPSDYTYLLLAAGWFNLSTALKGVRKKNREHLIINLPEGARYLIEDVLKGIVNPNILHDEIQISRAKSICVKEILKLYDEGVILLDLQC